MRFLCSPDFQHPFPNQLKVQKIICFLCYGFVSHCLPPAQPQPPAHTDRPTTAATSTTSTTTARTTTTTASTTTSTGTTVEATE
ncbi:salivary glue protein Sgs-3 [Plutella xylostella]|uniref:salivary glue protein Sgs-3 n=1 Tax=Plutella xylostella TaxID=51655 RepID=UPI002032A354|nr:salivary glue protein Sgs-3 [Plutella xylostella]